MSVEDVDWIDDDEAAATDSDGWRIENEADADWCLRLLARAEAEIAAKKQRERDEIARIKDRGGKVRARWEDTRTRMRAFLSDWLAESGAKSWQGMNGTVSAVKGRENIEVYDIDGFVAWAKDNEPELLRFQPDLTAKRWATFNTADDGTLFDGIGSGEVVPGVRVVMGEPGIRVRLSTPAAEIDDKGRPS